MTIDLHHLYEDKVFTPLDYRFALAMGRLSGDRDPLSLASAALVSRQTREGHVCVDIRRLAETPIEAIEDHRPLPDRWPEASEWRAALASSPMASNGDTVAPLVLDETGRLYLYKYWRYQGQLATGLMRLAQAETQPVDPSLLDACLDSHCGDRMIDGAPNLQRRSAQTAVERRLAIVTGGPGTGKTTAAIQMLLVLIDTALRAGRTPPRIAALAPTGKAAARLQEALQLAIQTNRDASAAMREALPTATSTIHRALEQTQFRAGRSQRGTLKETIVLIDEASMVDLALMNRVVSSLRTGARLILVGDKDQLASVESGAVMADVCDAAKQTSGALSDCVIELTRPHRFGEAGGIHKLAAAIRDGDTQTALTHLRSTALPEIELVSTTDRAELESHLGALVQTHLLPVYATSDPIERLRLLGRFRLLTAHRRGRQGQSGLNRFVEFHLRDQDAIDLSFNWYAGRPVMVSQNSYSLGLFNGDVGIILRKGSGEDRHRTVGMFLAADGTPRHIPTSQLPDVETVFAMTVHKSQGSEFDHVALFLPETRSPVVTRELLYTACTRAKQHVTVFGNETVIREAIETPIHRASGLRDRLVQGEDGSRSVTPKI